MADRTSKRIAVGLVVLGLLGIVVFLRAVASELTRFSYTPEGGPPSLDYVSLGEWRFLLLQAVWVTPCALAVVLGSRRAVARWVAPAIDRYASLGAKEYRQLGIVYAGLAFAMYRFGRFYVLRDLPITDDENAIDFGARVVASGRFLAPELEPSGAFLDLFLYTRDGLVTSFDWPGGVLVRALSFVTGLDQVLYAAIAAIGSWAVVATAHRAVGPRAGLVAALVLLASPLGLGMSMTTHAHVASRTFVALATLLYVRASLPRGDGPRSALVSGLGFGLAVGAACITRPFESMTLLGPPSFHLLWLALRGAPRARPLVGAAIVGFAAMIALFCFYNLQTTGVAWLPARFDRDHIHANVFPPGTLELRLTGHLAFNVMLLAVYFAGPLGLPLAVLGGLAGPRPLVVLGLGFLASVVLMLAHDNVGIHTAGPIHYTESVVPLTLLLAAGVAYLGEVSLARGGSRIEHLFSSYLVLGLAGLLTLPWLGQLRRQGDFVARPHEFLADHRIEHAIVLAPPLASMRPLGSAGSWQLQMPHPDPTMRADIVFALPSADPAALQARYPDRDIVLLFTDRRGVLGLRQLYRAPEPS